MDISEKEWILGFFSTLYAIKLIPIFEPFFAFAVAYYFDLIVDFSYFVEDAALNFVADLAKHPGWAVGYYEDTHLRLNLQLVWEVAIILYNSA